MRCKLLLVVSKDELPYVENSLFHLATPAWKESGQLTVWVWSPINGLLTELLCNSRVAWADIPAGATVVVTKSVRHVPLDRIKNNGSPLLVVSRSHYFTVNSPRLQDLLRTQGLSWRCHADALYQAYDHRSAVFGVDDWLHQFQQLGAPQLGEILMKVTRVMPTDECVRRLGDSYAGLQITGQPRIGVLSRMGKSGAALSGGLRRRFGGDCFDISECISQCAAVGGSHVIHIFEDGLWTGIELQKVIDSLLGRSDNPKVNALSDPSELNRNKIVLHFAVATDLGRYAANSIFKAESLPNFSIETGHAYHMNVLKPDAEAAFRAELLGFKDVRDFVIGREHIAPTLYGAMIDHLTEMQINHLMNVYRTVGAQLWQYTNQKSSTTLDQPALEHLAFGSNGIGSPIIFRHSAPRAASPFLWASGPVVWGKKSFYWNAIFPENGSSDHR